MILEKQFISYKDNAGFVFKEKDGFYRHISYEYKLEYEQLMQSGLYQKLVDNSLMVSHKEVNKTTALTEHQSQYKTVFPEQINFISYPFEWSFNQWREMLLCYIKINEMALQYGMILKDATPYNFTFHNNKCVLIDTSSFNMYEKGQYWIAYRQFCEEMLAPFALMYYKNTIWAKLYSSALNGLPLSFVSKQLPIKTYFNTCCLLHIHGHSFFQKKGTQKNTLAKSSFDKNKLLLLFKNFKSTILKWEKPLNAESNWGNYYEQNIESDIYLTSKIGKVKDWLSNILPATVIDLGANTGMFSFIAAEYANAVIAVEADRKCVDIIYKNIVQKKITNVTSVAVDIVEPSPGLGWANGEKMPLLQRLSGDVVMALALVHHICISRNVPINFVARLFATITTQFVIVEFVPKEDAKVQLLLRTKPDIFNNYSEEYFIESFKQYFVLIEVTTLETSKRKLFLWEKK